MNKSFWAGGIKSAPAWAGSASRIGWRERPRPPDKEAKCTHRWRSKTWRLPTPEGASKNLHRRVGKIGWLGAALLLWLTPTPLAAQQMTIGTPFRTVQEGFFEQIGVQWALQGRNWFAQFGGADLAQPAFGGFQPGAGLQAGWGFGGPGWSGQVQFSAAQGNTRTMTSGTPSVTVMNGAVGYVADTSLSPFVIGLIPVVGSGGLSPWVGMAPGVRVAGPQMPAWAPVPGTSKVDRFLAEGGQSGGGLNSSGQSGSRQSRSGPIGSIGPDRSTGRNSRDMGVLGGQIGPKEPEPGWEKIGFGGPEIPEGLPASRIFASPAGLPDSPRRNFPQPDASVDGSATRLAQAQQSSAAQAAPSVAEARALREAELQQAHQEALQYFQRGQEAEQAGKLNLARIYYRMAAQRASGDLKHQIQIRLSTLPSATAGKGP